MQLVLKAIRDILVADGTLTSTVAASDITSSFIAEVANFPCITISIGKGASTTEISGVTRAIVEINVNSIVNKQQLWEIYDQIKTLIHNQERNLTTGNRVFHLIYESSVDDTKFDSVSQSWMLLSKYEVLYGTTGLEITTGAVSGTIYADSTDVTADSGKEIAKFRGMVNLDIAFEHESHNASERFAKEVFFNNGTAIITIGEVMFKADSMNLLWDLTKNASDTLADDSTAATSYLVTQSTKPTYLQFLFRCLLTEDGKALEIEADKAVCEDLQIPFSNKDLSIYRCRWICLGDANSNVVRVSVEN